MKRTLIDDLEIGREMVESLAANWENGDLALRVRNLVKWARRTKDHAKNVLVMAVHFHEYGSTPYLVRVKEADFSKRPRTDEAVARLLLGSKCKFEPKKGETFHWFVFPEKSVPFVQVKNKSLSVEDIAKKVPFRVICRMNMGTRHELHYANESLNLVGVATTFYRGGKPWRTKMEWAVNKKKTTWYRSVSELLRANDCILKMARRLYE